MIKEIKDLAGMVPSVVLAVVMWNLFQSAMALIDAEKPVLAFSCVIAIFALGQLSLHLLLKWARS